jgi:hypothetical protein
MKTIDLAHIRLEIDVESTKKFYASQNGFVCDCPDCTNYISNIPHVQKSLDGLDKEIGFDLHKDVGQGMDELMPHDYDDSHLDVIPYYVVGKCFLDKKELDRQQSGPIWPDTKRAKKKLTDDLSLTIINTSGDIKISDADNVLTIWLEYRTEINKTVPNNGYEA